MNAIHADYASIVCAGRERRRHLMQAAKPAANARDTRAPQETELAARAVLALPDAPAKLLCLAGEVWLTREKGGEDHIVAAGASFSVVRGDRVVLEALRHSRIRLLPD